MWGNIWTHIGVHHTMKQVLQSRGLEQLDFTPPLKHHRIQPTWIELKPV
jgi:hypothetical protein